MAFHDDSIDRVTNNKGKIENLNLSEIKKSKIDKRGLYACRDIKKGKRIIEYKGKIISIKNGVFIKINLQFLNKEK